MGNVDSLAGEKLGQYRIERLIGQGAMGAVFAAHDDNLQRTVAVKVLALDVNRNPDAVKRFLREARAIAAISHPNIAQVYGSGTHGDFHYYAMEYIDGESLEELIAREGRIGGARAFNLMVQAVNGLQAAADHGVIHRDLKPANFMVAKDGTLKIVDFGIAKTAGDGESLRTATGAVMGTPAYMSPEQCRGERVDIRSDMYSLGCTFFHMLTGRVPFEGETLFTVMERQISTSMPSITAMAPNVPDRLCNIIYTMVEKSPERRYQTYEQLQTLLEAARDGRATVLTSMVVDVSEAEMEEADRRSLKKLYLAAGLVAVLFIVWILATSNREPEVKTAEAPPETVDDKKPEGGLSGMVDSLRELNEFDKELRKDAREAY